MENSYIIPIYLKETEGREKNIFSNNTANLKLQEKQITAKDVVDIIEKNLQEIKEEKNNIEIYFLGEYFTKLDLEKQKELLASVYTYIKEGKITNIIINAMPQDISKENLKILKKYKVKTIKLEIGSCNDYLLKRAGYNFSYEDIKKSSKLIKRYGINLVYKIYIGLPEATKLDEINTAKTICKLKPKQVEIYNVETNESEEVVNNEEYEELTIIQSVERAKEITYILSKKKIKVEIMDETDKKFKKRVESGIWFDTIVERIKKYNIKVKEVEIKVNVQDYENALGFNNENIEKLKEYYDVASKVVKKEEIKPGKIEIIVKKKFTDFLEE